MPGETKFFQPYHKPSKKLIKTPDAVPIAPQGQTVVAQFKSPEGHISDPLNLPANATPDQLQLLLNNLLQNEDPLPYLFSVNDVEIQKTLHADVIHAQELSTENVFTILYQPLAVFKVKAVSRCTASLSGHTEAILSVAFSPNGNHLATGSGDTTVRLWDLNTETPHHTLKGHVNWVQIVSWSPDSKILASGSMDSTIRLWDPKTGKALGEPLKAHSQCITSISWEPMHQNMNCNRFASASKDGSVRVWDATLRKIVFVLSQHTAPVMCVKWGGEGYIYTASRDKTIKIWDATKVKRYP
jgi:ribosome assembly protein 4